MEKFGFGTMIEKLKKAPKTIVFTEGTDERILEASARLLAGTWLTPVLVGNEAEVHAAAEREGFNIRGARVLDPATYEGMDAMVAKMVELRKGKMTEDECRTCLLYTSSEGRDHSGAPRNRRRFQLSGRGEQRHLSGGTLCGKEVPVCGTKV